MFDGGNSKVAQQPGCVTVTGSYLVQLYSEREPQEDMNMYRYEHVQQEDRKMYSLARKGEWERL